MHQDYEGMHNYNSFIGTTGLRVARDNYVDCVGDNNYILWGLQNG